MASYQRNLSRKKSSMSRSRSNVETCSLFQRRTPSKYETSGNVQELVDVFNYFDANGDGLISACELGGVMRSLGYSPTREQLSRMIRNVDSDGDGYISLEEFVEMNTKEVDVNNQMQELKNAFKLFDLDKNGRISANELHSVLRSLGDGSTLEDCREMIRSVDTNGDGLVSFDEFKLLMMNA